MSEAPETHRLFSYGTLRLERVQRRLFGRLVPTEPDALLGWRIEQIGIHDPAVLEASGLSHHPALIRSGAPKDRVEGSVLTLTPAELAAADAYEVAAYVRVSTLTERERTAYAYVLADTTTQGKQRHTVR